MMTNQEYSDPLHTLSNFSQAMLFRLLAKNIPNSAVFLLDKNLLIVMAEGQPFSDLKIDPHSYEGKSVKELFLDDIELIAQYQVSFRGVELKRDYDQGQNGYFTVHTLPSVDAQGAITHIVAIVENISERLRSQQALSASLDRNQALLEALPDMMFVITRQGTITDYHIPTEIAMLYADVTTPENVAELNNLQFLTPQLIEGFYKVLNDTFNTDKVISFEFELKTPKGGLIFLDARTLRVNDEEFVAIIRDITSRRSIEADFAERNKNLEILSMFDQELNYRLSVNYVLEQALDSVVRLSNAAGGFIALVGENGLELKRMLCDATLQSLHRALSPKNQALHEALQRDTLTWIENIRTYQTYMPIIVRATSAILIPLIAQDKKLGIIVLETFAPNEFSQKTIEFLKLLSSRISTALDNSILYAQTEEYLLEVKQINEKLFKAEQLKTDMIRIASHDLKNPLAGITGYLEFMRSDTDNPLTPDQLNYMNEIQGAVRRMEQLILGILSLERIEQMSTNQVAEILDVNLLAEQATVELRPRATQKNQKIELLLSQNPATILGDGFQLYEAISNLVSNAIKYTPDQGSISIQVDTLEHTIEFRVVDSGFGIPEAMQARLFSPFFRAKTRETSTIEGSGIGLHLVKNIIERHNGRMIFASEYKHGSTFGFSLVRYQSNTNA
jgi:signal transduction histidine kinase